MEKKFELTDETIVVNGRTLHRIGALKDFGNVKKGDLGGFVEKEENLSHRGKCWIADHAYVYDKAHVYGDAWVYGKAHVYGDAIIKNDAWVYGNAEVYGNARVYDSMHVMHNADVKSVYDICYIEGFGSRSGSTTFFRCKDGSIKVSCGCFIGTLDEFREKVKETHGDNKYAKEYLLIADAVKLKLSNK